MIDLSFSISSIPPILVHEIGGSEPFKHPLSHYDLQEPVSGVFHDELSKWMLGKMGSNYLLLIL